MKENGKKERQIKGVNLLALMLLVGQIVEEYKDELGSSTQLCDVYVDMSLIDCELFVDVYKGV